MCLRQKREHSLSKLCCSSSSNGDPVIEMHGTTVSVPIITLWLPFARLPAHDDDGQQM